MKNSFRIIISLGLGLSLAHHSLAAEIKVMKVKGSSAIVKFEGMTPEKGMTYTIGEDGDNESDNNDFQSSSSGGGRRDKALSVGFSFASTSETQEAEGTSVDAGSTSAISFDASYGWNTGSLEIGPKFSYVKSTVKETSVNETEVSSSQFRLGPYGEFNFVPNKPGTSTVPGIGAHIQYVSSSDTTNDGTTTTEESGSGLAFGAYAFGKFFISDTAAIKATLGYELLSTKTDEVTSKFGKFFIGAGLNIYF